MKKRDTTDPLFLLVRMCEAFWTKWEMHPQRACAMVLEYGLDQYIAENNERLVNMSDEDVFLELKNVLKEKGVRSVADFE